MASQCIVDGLEQDQNAAYSSAIREHEAGGSRRITDRIRASEMQYRRLFESAQDGILILDADSEKIIDVNPFLIALLGFPYEHFIGKQLWEIGVFKDITVAKATFVNLQAEGYVRYENLPLERKDGRHMEVEFVSNVYMVGSVRIIQCNIRDITARKAAEAASKMHARQVQALLDLHLLTHATRETIMDFVIEACKRITESQYSFLGMMNESETVMTLYRWSTEAMDECSVSSQPIEYPISTAGLWSECVHQRKAVRCNDYPKSHHGKKGLPEGHVPIHRFMAVPVFDGDRIVALATVANKDCDYDESDENTVSILIQKMWGILSRQQQDQERILLEEQYRQSQKMEAIGQLAGGIAHDFNNILQAITGYSTMLLELLPKDCETHEYAEEISRGAERAAALTRQLLTFSRRQIVEMEDLEINDVVHGMSKMVLRLLGENVEMNLVTAAPCSIRADRAQLEQVLLNLCLNARDAMPEGGTLVIKTESMTIDKEYCDLNRWALPGRYAVLSITDNGCGMHTDTLEHIYEPFFTTKDVGKGTGLGLATAYGIVRQHKGMMQVYSKLGLGTTFSIYLPAVDEGTLKKDAAAITRPKGGEETILVAEDEEPLRKLVSKILNRAGYTVLLAANGEEALQLYKEHAGSVDLCLLDMVMPKMGGKAVYDTLKQQYPGLQFLFTSGYNTAAMDKDFVLQKGIQLIQKPCSPHALLNKIRQILDATY
jgi:PAS domain S-box-containing protein